MREIWRTIMAELLVPDDYRRDWYGHATNQSAHAYAAGFPIGMCLGFTDPLLAAAAVFLAYMLLWEVAIQRRGARSDQLQDSTHVALGALCGSAAMSGQSVLLIVGWIVWALLICVGVVHRIVEGTRDA